MIWSHLFRNKEEFAMFTTGGRWSNHVHLEGSLISSQGDRVIIQFFRNKKSRLSDPYGHRSMLNKDSDLISPKWRPFNK